MLETLQQIILSSIEITFAGACRRRDNRYKVAATFLHSALGVGQKNQ